MLAEKIKSNTFLGFFSVSAFLLLWEIAGRLKWIDPMFISYPTRVISDGIDLVLSGKITPHFIISVETLLLGFLLAVVVGVLGGLLIGSDERLYALFRPYVLFLNSLPKIAIVPLIIIWFGIGFSSKVVIVFLMSLIPILMNSIEGSRNVNGELVRMARSFKFRKREIMAKVVFFNAIPFVFAGMRMAAGKAVIGLVIAEVFGYGKGMGYLLSFYGTNFQTSRLMFLVLVFAALNLSLIRVIGILEKKVVKWKA
ncbi:MAG: Binding-protein-dependent transport system inner membrane component [Candidatus Moranbacteria bacterium GW2011_GWE1_49_15]|nr:MAG: Binding-protein-dependent transport system inner membrane component [Candidatus Moranbacteria bacterium GW2011_GWE2_47_10]KKW07298.1 MAG: Binding-protein-dependent transport system inner membrane component [Candidatus Moranbacteria bacterium GW2011_GWE1_49_15]